MYNAPPPCTMYHHPHLHHQHNESSQIITNHHHQRHHIIMTMNDHHASSGIIHRYPSSCILQMMYPRDFLGSPFLMHDAPWMHQPLLWLFESGKPSGVQFADAGHSMKDLWITSWWFQPHLKNLLVKLDHFPR